MAIYFFNQDIDFPDINEKKINAWVEKLIASHGKKRGKINFIFTSDAHILKVNQDFLQHDYYTDIITFDYSTPNKLSGDIFISLDTVASNSQKFNQTFSNELNRVIIHGVLHLIGFKDKSEAEASEMRNEENIALKMLDTIS